MSEDRTGAPGSDDAGDLEALDDLLGVDDDTQQAAEDLDTQPQGGDGAEPAEPAQPRQLTREERRVQLLRQRLETEQAENRRMRELWAQSMGQPRPAPPPEPQRSAEAERAEAERVAAMLPHEQAAYYASQAEARMNNQLARARLEVGDLFDRQAFASVQRDEPLARQWANQIEQMLTLARQQGHNPTREALYNQLLAQQVRERGKRDGDRQRRNGRAAIQRQTTQPGGSRSTVAPGRNRREDDYDAVVERLRNTRLGDVW